MEIYLYTGKPLRIITVNCESVNDNKITIRANKSKKVWLNEKEFVSLHT